MSLLMNLGVSVLACEFVGRCLGRYSTCEKHSGKKPYLGVLHAIVAFNHSQLTQIHHVSHHVLRFQQIVFGVSTIKAKMLPPIDPEM